MIFLTLYTTFPHNLIKELLDLIKRAFKKIFIYLACNDRKTFFTSIDHKGYKYKLSQKALSTLSIQKIIIVITKNFLIQKINFLQYRLLYYNMKQSLTVRVSETAIVIHDS